MQKFYDANADGQWTPGEPAITGWQVTIQDAPHVWLDSTSYTPVDYVDEGGSFAVGESRPVQANWNATTAISVNATINPGQTTNVSFGNLCLGPGGGLTLGFWSNKNGEKLYSPLRSNRRAMNVDAIRSHFPALQRSHNGHPVAYFDAPGGTQVPRTVAEAMTDYLFHHNANTHWAYPSSEETDAIIAGARAAMADLLNARPDEIAFGHNMTTLTFHLGCALGRMWGEGDEIIVTELDHHANIAPWQALAVDRGVTIRSAAMICETGQLDYDHLASLVNERTKLIAVGGASNAIGTINDLHRVVKIAKDAGALTFVDAVHLTPHELIDVQDLGCDFLACSSYKFYGPHAGILYGRHELLDTLPFPKLLPAPDRAPERVETGTQNHEGIAGIAATVDFLASIGGDGGTRRERLTRAYAALHAEGLRLTRMLWDGLTSMKHVRVYGPPPTSPRTPTVSFAIHDARCDDVARALAAHGVFASSGDFYAATVCQRYGIESLVRVGCAAYTTEEEVQRLLSGVAESPLPTAVGRGSG